MTLSTAMLALTHELGQAGSRAVSGGLVIGSGGNLSARDPDSGLVAITGSGTWLDALDTASFSIVDPDGQVVDGHPAPSSELPMHLACYAARPDAHAAIHLHPQLCVLLDALDTPIRMITTDHTYYVRKVVSVPWLPSGSQEIAAASSAALADGTNCCVLAHHGCITLGSDVGLAFKRAANLEEASLMTLRALGLGDTDTVCPPAYRQSLDQLEADGVTDQH